MPRRRIFVKNLPEAADEPKLQSAFAPFGEVTSIEVKERKSSDCAPKDRFFAYITLETDEQSLHKCFEHFSGRRWFGQFIDLELAKESFLERLQKERESQGNGLLKPQNPPEVVTNKIKPAEKKPVPNPQVKPKPDLSASEIKRLKSIEQLKKGYQMQKSAIKAALSNVDFKVNNKITFEEETVDNREVAASRQLFDSDNEGDDLNFEVRPQFEGEGGQRLLQLQSRFKNDRRFALDERFLEKEGREVPVEGEKDQQLGILEEILGQRIQRRNGEGRKGMLRFDPSQPEHSRFEIKPSEAPKKKKRKREELQEVPEEPQPVVSKDIFYKVSDGLKSALEEAQGFSLLNAFGKKEEENEEEEEERPKKIKGLKGKVGYESNPFKYDSTDEEDETEKVKEEEETKDKRVAPSTAFWSEPFFFKDDDYRLQEGSDFVKRIASAEKSTEFGQLRRDLKEIVKAKVRHNQKKNKPFKKKLGGKKRKRINRINKALNR